MSLVPVDLIQPWGWENRVKRKEREISQFRDLAGQARGLWESGRRDEAKQVVDAAAPKEQKQSPYMKGVQERLNASLADMREKRRTGVQAQGGDDDDGGFLKAVKSGVSRIGRTVAAADEAITDAGYAASRYNPLGRAFGVTPPTEAEIEGASPGERFQGGLQRAGDIGMASLSGERFVNNIAGRDVTSGLPTPVRYGIESFAAPVTLATAGTAGLAGGGLKAVGQAVARRWAMEGSSDLVGRVTAEQVAGRLPEGTPDAVRLGTGLLAGVAGGAATYKGLQNAPDIARGVKAGIDAQGGLASEVGELRLPGRKAVEDAAAVADDVPPIVPPDTNLPFATETVPGPGGRPLDIPDVGFGAADEAIAAKAAVDTGPGALSSRFGPVKWVKGTIVPAVKLDPKVRVAYRAASGVKAQLKTQFSTAMSPYVDGIEKAMKLDPPRYIGPEATTKGQKALIGTVKDIADRPEAYEIGPQLRRALDDYGAAQWNNVTAVVRGGYGDDVLPYTADGKEGFIYLPTLRSADTEPEAIQKTVNMLSKSRASKERAYATAWERAARHDEFVPETGLRELTGRHAEGMALNAQDATFKRATQGKTLQEVMEETHAGLREMRDEALQRVTSLRARINTAIRQAGGLEDEADELDKALAQFDRGMPEGGMRPLSRSGTVLKNAEGKIDELRADRTVRKMTGGGPVRIDVPPTDSALAQADAMERVTRAFGDVIPDDVKNVSKLDTAMARTRRRIDLLAERKDVRVNRLASLRKELTDAEDMLDRFRQAWRTAEIPPDLYARSNSTGLYHAPDVARQIDGLRTNATGWEKAAVAVSDEIRAAHLAGDFSPVTVQGFLAALSDPTLLVKAARGVFGGNLRPQDALKRIAMTEADDVAQYTFATGRPFGRQALELSVEQGKRGLGRIPVARKMEDELFAIVELASYQAWKGDRDRLLKWNPGRDANWAANEAARTWEKLVPSLSATERGVGTRRAGLERVIPTSMSFALSPGMLLSDAASGMVKLAGARTIDPLSAWRSLNGREQLAIVRGIQLSVSVAALAAASAAASAPSRGLSVQDAVQRAVADPNSPEWMSIQLGEGRRIPIGGPMRSFLKAVLPNRDGVPFHGLPGWAESKANTLVRVPKDLLQNEDFRGNAIMSSPHGWGRALQAIYYAAENTVPITLGEAMEQVRLGEATPGTLTQGAVTQFGGVNYTPPSPSERLHQIARSEYGEEFWNLSPSQKKAIKDEHAGLWAEYVDKASETVKAAERAKTQFMDEQTAADRDLLAGKISLQDWASGLDDRRNQLVGAERVIYADLDKGGKRDAILDPYYAAIDRATVNGAVDWEQVDAYVGGLPRAQQQYIKENTGLTQTPLTKLRKTLQSEYYALPRYRGYSAAEAKAIDDLLDDAYNVAGPGASKARKLRALREVSAGADPKVVSAARLQIIGYLKETNDRQRWRAARPESALIVSRGRLSSVQLQAIRAAL